MFTVGQETSRKVALVPGGGGVGWICQLAPFQASTNGRKELVSSE
jgi:hypothetical protein